MFDKRATRAGRLGLATPLVIAGIVLATVNLRPAIASLSPILEQIERSNHLTSATAGLLTTLPVICFGLAAPFAPRLAARFGVEQTILLTMVLTTAGIALRVVPEISALFVGTAIIGSAIGIANVLLPALVKRDFPRHTGSMMGIYAMCLAAGSAISSGLTVPLERLQHIGWRPTLAEWAIFAAIAAAVWLPSLRIQRWKVQPLPLFSDIWRKPLAWAVTAFFGLQSLGFYSSIAWVPTLFEQHGISASEAGWLLSFSAFVSIPAAFVAPLVATRLRDQRLAVAICCIAYAGGLAGLLADPVGGAWIWMAIIGLAQGAAISFALTMVVLRSADSSTAAQLSGMAQSAGYLIAALGPFIIGALRDATSGWQIPIIALIVAAVLQLLAGVQAGRNATVQVGERWQQPDRPERALGPLDVTANG